MSNDTGASDWTVCNWNVLDPLAGEWRISNPFFIRSGFGFGVSILWGHGYRALIIGVGPVVFTLGWRFYAANDAYKYATAMMTGWAPSAIMKKKDGAA